MTVVVVDANVLYGIEITDLLLTLATRRMFRVHWSAEILDEVQRNLAKRADLSTAAIAYRIELMNRALPTALAEAPADLIASMPVNDKDRHVLALAVLLGAQAVVTHNLRGFPTVACEPFGVEALGTDEFLYRQAQLDPAAIVDAFGEMAQRRKRPPKTVAEIVDRLAPTLPTFVAFLRKAPGI